MEYLKSLLGDKYKDDMTADEIDNALSEIGLIRKSDTVTKEMLDRATSEAADWKKKYRATLDEKTRLADEQKETTEALRTELEAMKKEKSISDMSAKFIEIGYTPELAKETAVAQYEGDYGTFFSNMKKYSDELKTSLKSKAQDNTPAPPVGTGTGQSYSQYQTEALKNNDLLGYVSSVIAESKQK